jgi:hypothetical protein
MSVSRKELYSGSMVIFIAFFYLISAGLQVWQASANGVDWPDIKMLLLALFYLASGTLLLLQRNAGWIMTTGVLLNFVLVMLVFLISLSQGGVFNAYAAMALMLFFLLLLALIFLFNRNTRKKFSVNNKSYLATITVYVLLIAVNFLI